MILQVEVSPLPEALSNCLRPDAKILPAYSQSCTNYRAEKHITYAFLYPPRKCATANYEATVYLINSSVTVMLIKNPNVLCQINHTLAIMLLSLYFLFFIFLFTELSSNWEKKYDAVLITNTVPMYPAFKSKILLKVYETGDLLYLTLSLLLTHILVCQISYLPQGYGVTFREYW